MIHIVMKVSEKNTPIPLEAFTESKAAYQNAKSLSEFDKLIHEPKNQSRFYVETVPLTK